MSKWKESSLGEFPDRTEYFRFFGRIGKVTHDMLTRYTQIDYDREIALVAKVKDGDKNAIAGVVRLVSDSNNDAAEFAILVADQWQGQGLGNKFHGYDHGTCRKAKYQESLRYGTECQCDYASHVPQTRVYHSL